MLLPPGNDAFGASVGATDARKPTRETVGDARSERVVFSDVYGSRGIRGSLRDTWLANMGGINGDAGRLLHGGLEYGFGQHPSPVPTLQ
jgi:hypothetical protein